MADVELLAYKLKWRVLHDVSWAWDAWGMHAKLLDMMPLDPVWLCRANQSREHPQIY